MASVLRSPSSSLSSLSPSYPSASTYAQGSGSKGTGSTHGSSGMSGGHSSRSVFTPHESHSGGMSNEAVLLRAAEELIELMPEEVGMHTS